MTGYIMFGWFVGATGMMVHLAEQDTRRGRRGSRLEYFTIGMAWPGPLAVICYRAIRRRTRATS